MRRVRLLEAGWQKELSFEANAPDPPAPVGAQVLVQLEAIGVCHRDLIDRAGRFAFMQFPITPGHEGAGRVVAVGPEVSRWRVGDRVATMHRDSCGQCAACVSGEPSLCGSAAFVLGILADGTYATHILAPESALFAVPGSLPAAHAAVHHCTLGTAWRGLGPLAAGQRLLVTGANGGVGVAAVQLGVRRGAEVIAQVRDERHREQLLALGAHEVVVDDGSALHKKVRGIDVALECVGQPTFNGALRSLALGGRLVAIGNVVDERVALNLGYIIVNALRVVGSSGASPADMAALFAFTAEKPVIPPIAAELALADAEEAQRRVRAGGLWGRVVLRPD